MRIGFTRLAVVGALIATAGIAVPASAEGQPGWGHHGHDRGHWGHGYDRHRDWHHRDRHHRDWGHHHRGYYGRHHR